MKQVPILTPPSSDDEDEDRHNLIPQNDDPIPIPISPFHIDEKLTSSIKRRFSSFNVRRLGKSKTYLLMFLVPFLVVLVYFSVDFTALFRSSRVWDLNLIPPDYSPQSQSDRMRESELRALYLLKEQHLGLVHLLKTVESSYRLHSTNDTDNGSYSNNVKAKILNQISINNQVQKVLFSTHVSGNLNAGEFGNATLGAVDLCGKKNTDLSGRRTIEWNPRSNKYLLAICVSGHMSNHLICLEKHMFFAAVLKRILVIPSHKVDYQNSRVLDIEHINRCLGKKVAVTFEEFKELKKKKKDTRINKFICYFPNCCMDEEHIKKLRYLGLSLPKLESPWTDDVRSPKKRTVDDLEAKLSSDEEVIAIGDVFFADVEREWVSQPGGPIAHKCKTLVEPNRLIMITAQRFVQTFLGRNYVALHFRRHDFLNFCNAKNTSCFYPLPQAANCIQRVVERAKAPVIYLSTDAAESEIQVLRSLIGVNGNPVPLVKRPPRSSAEKWDSLLYRHGLHDDLQVEAMLDKTICALSSVFIGSSGSTLTEDILRLRKDWGSASVCDEYVCQGELPDFIADDE